MTYQDQLKTPEWKRKREEIIARDNSACTNCGLKRSTLLNLSIVFGVKNYNEMISEGFEIKRNHDNKILVGKGILFPIKLINTDQHIPVTQLCFANQWSQPKNKFEFSRCEFVAFQKEFIDDKSLFDLNVHHKYYQKGKLAWDYDNDALVTLCVDCHKIEHEQTRIPVYNEHRRLLVYSTICNRCNGRGVLKEYQYNLGGSCFKCWGAGDIIDSD